MDETIFPVPTGTMGKANPRYEARDKVTGAAMFASDVKLAGVAHAYLVMSKIGRGTITAINLEPAQRIAGVIDILTYKTVGDNVRYVEAVATGGYVQDSYRPLWSNSIAYWGQPVALVVAETFEIAREAAQAVEISYDIAEAADTFDSAGAETVVLEQRDLNVGNFGDAFAAAKLKIDARYSTPTQHQNAIELFATQCAWDGDRLTVYEPSQSVNNIKHGLAQQLGIDANNIRVLSPYIGGGFGSKGFLTHRTSLVALASRKIGRPVKLVVPREQGYALSGYRAESRHHVQLAADHDGKLLAVRHEGWEVTSRADLYAIGGNGMTVRLFACPNVQARLNSVRVDRSTPGAMRGPTEVAYGFAFESALDELAYEVGIDPIELRRRNDTKIEPIENLPYTSRSLMECFDAASSAFGWERRSVIPGSMRDGDWLLGWGCAGAHYPTYQGSTSVRVRLFADGRVHVATAGHELGQGMYTVIAQVAAEQLSMPFENVQVSMGDTELPPSMMAAGSSSTASVAPAIMSACDAIKMRLKIDGESQMTVMEAMSASGLGAIEEYAETRGYGQPPNTIQQLFHGAIGPSGGVHLKDRVQFTMGAQFVEVRVHTRTREIRVSRAVGAFAAGRIINPRTAHGQLLGGMIWGISSALHDKTEIDSRNASYINNNLGDYLLPVNADVVDIQALMVPEEDTIVNAAGVKGVGEISVVGMAAAIANAVYHATGQRLRDLPLRLDNLLT